MTTKLAHTLGALRAAQVIGDVLGTRSIGQDEMADIISRETGDADLLEALEFIRNLAEEQEKEASLHDAGMYASIVGVARAALAKGRGQQ